MAVLSDGRIVSSSDDTTVRIWNSDTGECVRVLEGHSKVSVTIALMGVDRVCMI